MLDLKDKKQLITFLFDSKMISFSTKALSPYDINLRLLSSYPEILKYSSHLFGELLKGVDFNLIAGPYTDIPLATTISLEFNWPMIYVREERKDHGTERIIEGNFESGKKVVVVDDEIDDVSATLQLIGRLEGSGLKVVKIYVLLDREYGALQALKEKGYECVSLITLNDIFLELTQEGKISSIQLEQLKSYLENQRREFLIKLKS